MPKQKGQSFLHGAIILSAATIIVKLIGALFKLPLFNLLGGDGMGYFGTAYNLFNPIYALAISGFPVAVSKLVSEQIALRRFRDVRRILTVSKYLFIGSGLIGFLIIFFGAGPFVKLIDNPGSYLAVVAIAPSIFFCCIMSIYRGYYVGMSNMYPTAISQVIEAVVKLICGLGFAWGAMRWCMGQYETTGRIMGQVVPSIEQAQSVACAYGAAGAVLGMTVSTFVGAVYLWARHKRRGDGITQADLMASPVADSTKNHFKRLVMIAIPVCLSAVVVNLTSLIDLMSLMNRVGAALESNAQAILQMYEGLIPQGKQLSEIPNYLYGSYQCAITLFNLVPTLTSTFGVSALPAVASAWALKNRELVRKNVESVIRITCLIAIPAGIGLCVLSEPILLLIYSARPQEAMIAAPILRIMGLAVIFVAVTTPVNSMLQGVGQVFLAVKLMLIGGALKLGINYFAVAIPELNIQGAPLGTLACYVFIAVAGIAFLCNRCQISLDMKSVFVKPLVAAIFCGAGAWGAYGLLQRINALPQSVCTVLAIGVAGVVYLLVLFLIKGISKEDINMLPNGEKLAQLLEKHKLIR